MKFISYVNKFGDIKIINLDKLITAHIEKNKITIILENDCNSIIQSDPDDPGLFRSLSSFFNAGLPDDRRLHNSTRIPQENAATIPISKDKP